MLVSAFIFKGTESTINKLSRWLSSGGRGKMGFEDYGKQARWQAKSEVGKVSSKLLPAEQTVA
jgi:hypothetical protein